MVTSYDPYGASVYSAPRGYGGNQFGDERGGGGMPQGAPIAGGGMFGTWNTPAWDPATMNSIFNYQSLPINTASALAQQQYASGASLQGALASAAASRANAAAAAAASMYGANTSAAGGVAQQNIASGANVGIANAGNQKDLIAAAMGDEGARLRLQAQLQYNASQANQTQQWEIAKGYGSGSLFDNIAARLAQRGGPLPGMGGALNLSPVSMIQAPAVGGYDMNSYLNQYKPAAFTPGSFSPGAMPSINTGGGGGGAGGGMPSMGSLFSSIYGNVNSAWNQNPVFTGTPTAGGMGGGNRGGGGMASGGTLKPGEAALIGEGHNYEGLLAGTAEIALNEGDHTRIIPLTRRFATGGKTGGGYGQSIYSTTAKKPPASGQGSTTTPSRGWMTTPGAYQPQGVQTRFVTPPVANVPTAPAQQAQAPHPLGGTSPEVHIQPTGEIKISGSNNPPPTDSAAQTTPGGVLGDVSNIPAFNYMRGQGTPQSIYSMPTLSRPDLGFGAIPDPFHSAATYDQLLPTEKTNWLQGLKSLFSIDPENAINMMNQSRIGWRNNPQQALGF